MRTETVHDRIKETEARKEVVQLYTPKHAREGEPSWLARSS
jgi:hypothetical protein